MYPEYARDTHTELGRSRRAPTTSASTSAAAVAAIAEHRPAWCCSPRPTTPPAPRCPWTTSPPCCDAAPGHGRGRRGVRRVPPGRHAERAHAAAALPAAGRHPHHEQGVRLRRRRGSATSRPRRPSSTPCASSGCPITCPPLTQAGRARRAGPRRPSCWPRSATCAPTRDDTVAWLRAQRAAGRRLRRQLRAVRPVRRPARRCGRGCSIAAC